MLTLLTTPDIMALLINATLIVIALLAVTATPFVAVFSQQLAIQHKKIFFDKFAKQLCTMGTTLGGIFLTCLATGGISLVSQQPKLLEGPLRLPIMIVMACVVFAFALMIAYTLLWKPMRKSKQLHMLIGTLTAISLLSAYFMAAGLMRGYLLPGHPFDGLTTAQDILIAMYTIPAGALFWPIFTQSLLFGCATSGMFGLGYLLLRRNKDDFGRDYYKFSLAYCAKWAFIPMLLQILPLGWLLSQMNLSFNPATVATDPIIWCWGIAAILPLLATVLWMCIAKSETPLRHKASIIIAIPLVWLAAAAQITVLLFQLNIIK